MKDKFVVPAVFAGINRKVDRSLSLRFVTSREVSAEDFVLIDSYFQREGWLVFAENQIQEEDIPTQLAEVEAKTPAQRLRSVMFVYWKQLGEEGDFEDFYRKNIEKIIEQIKSKLD